MNSSRLIFALPSLLKYISNKNNKNFYLVPFLNGTNVISIFLKIIYRKFNLICTIHNPVSSHYKYTTIKDKIIILLLLLFKHIPDKYITCSKFIKKELINKYKFNSRNIKYVYNPLNFLEMKQKSSVKNLSIKQFKKNNKIIISIGRLAYQKNFGSLILKLKNILFKNNIIFIIIGTGEYYQELKNLIKLHKLTKKVFLLGYKSNPFNYLKNSDLFILNSRWEGLGSVLIESLFLKVPIVCNKCPGGIEEIFESKNNYSIFNFNNKKKFEKTIFELIYSKKKSKFMFDSKILKKFDIKRASNEYLKFILK